MEKNNAVIFATFKTLLDMLDARKHVNVFELTDDGKQVLRFESTPVYHLLDISNECNFDDYEVKALNAGLIASILIQKEAHNNGV